MEMLTSDGFVAALLAACPELSWPDCDDDDGVYPAFGLGILPALADLLPPLLDSTSNVRSNHIDEYQRLPRGGTREAADLVTRLYSFLEHAAAAGDETVTHAIGLELGNGGYRELTSSQLVSLAGPLTQNLVLGQAER